VVNDRDFLSLMSEQALRRIIITGRSDADVLETGWAEQREIKEDRVAKRVGGIGQGT